jgi:hypothetical protein
MKRTLPFILASFLAAMPALAADVTRPTIGTPGPGQATANVPVNVTVDVSDGESGIATCSLFVDNDDVGSMTVAGNTASKSYAFAQAGIHTMFVFCRDNENNFNSGANASVTVTVASGGSGDGTPPTVGAASPGAASADVAVTLSAPVSDAGGIAACQLIVDGFTQGAMTVAGGTASRQHVFEATGTHTVSVQCSDNAGNTATGSVTVVSVADTPSQPPPPVLALTPALVKLACPQDAGADHACKAVYYRDTAGKRHAFPNAKVYFTWYADFSGVEEITPADMAAMPLGKQVTYRPGVRLVKFTTLNNVYAVARGGTLRWIKTEAAAAGLYGADWNKKIDDISDAFFLDYEFGADIASATEFSPATETAAASSIDLDL